jgi:SAM-dependent methyltransferase
VPLRAGLIRLIDLVLRHPAVFALQQGVCNNYSAIRREFADVFDRQGLRILDIGCSTATCAASAVDMEANAYTGIDVNTKYVAFARRRYPRATFLVMDARRMTFEPASFDVAMFVGVIHHMDDDRVRDCLTEVRRVVAPGGRVIVAEPVFTPGRWFSNFLLSLDRGRFIRDVAGYRALLDGVTIERQRFFNFSAHRFCSFVLKTPTVHPKATDALAVTRGTRF